ncbi:MAG: 4'-phosphopantetheinyl transferase superfamily protein [Bacteroidaceae bacterium]|nr:4'-phosphopantetheinyl transferase superfamily protein [Bacteroidaceae bacterium]
MYRLYISTEIQSFSLDDALQEISAERREKALTYKFEQGRRECVLAYLLLKKALKETFGIEGNPVLIEQEGGKPVLKDFPNIHFNISHCKEAVACVVGDEPLGVDVERIREYSEQLAHYTLNEEELQEVQNSAYPAKTFIRFWTMKESLLKYTGQGIRDDLKTVLNTKDVIFDTQEEKDFIVTVCRKAR